MSTTTPNMNLSVPGVGTENGPDYAIEINNDLSLLDIHDHSPSRGVQITPNGLNINTSLTLNNNFLTSAAGITFQAQGSTPANNTIYESGVDLYYVDGLGNNVRITQSGGIAGSPGSIANLTSPASAAYVALNSTFVWESNTSIAANMDFGSAILRNLSPNSTFGLTLQPPSLSSDYSITLPILPASQKIMTLDASGVMSAPYVVDNSTIEINSNTIRVKDAGITNAKLAANSVGTSNIIDANVTSAKIQSNINLPGLLTLASSKPLVVSNSTVPANLAVLRSITNDSGAIVSGEGFSSSVIASDTVRFTVTGSAFLDGMTVVVTAGHPVNAGKLYIAQTATSFVDVAGFSSSIYSVHIFAIAVRN